MNSTKLANWLAPFICVASLLSTAPLASAAQPQTSTGMPKTPEEWVQYLSDFTQNADALVDPKKFIATLSAVTEPQFALAALSAMMNPERYMQSVVTLMDPRAYTNYARTMDPKTVTDWTQALMDPQFYTALTYVFTDPNKLYRWLLAPLDPKVMSVVLNMLNPNIYLRWGMIGLDPRLWSMLSSNLNPSWSAAWLNTFGNPTNYGATIGGWPHTPNTGTLPPYPSPGLPLMPAPRP